MASAKRPRESYEDDAENLDEAGPSSRSHCGVDAKLYRRRSSCIRAGDLFLSQLNDECETPLISQYKQQRTETDSLERASSPLALPSLRKLRFKQENTPARALAENDEGDEREDPLRGVDEAAENEDKNNADDADLDDDGFIIRCSQHYERSCDLPNHLEGTPENVCSTLDSQPHNATATENNVNHTPLASRSQAPIELDFPSTSGANLTSSCMKTPNYSIFRSASDRKTVHIIRHGESVYNAIDRYSRSLEDPFVFDAPLTDVGRQQALALKEKLTRKVCNLGAGDILFVTSPLTRCIQTMLTAYNQIFSASASKDGGRELPVIKVCSHMAEHLATTGDIGKPKSHLVKAFPKISEAFRDLEEHWWWQPEKNDALSMRFDSREPKKHLQKRVGLFRQWVLRQPHKVIIAFGHSTFWKEFSGSVTRLRNCEVDTIFV